LLTVVDETAATFPTVFVSAGRRGLDVALAPDDLVRVTGAVLAPIGRPDG
jgi:Cys-tRNA(Pro)/Cys-tRNA(Cys) deacylase